MKALPSKRTSEYIAEQIADEILSGRILAGMELKQEELADSIGASRIPVREALQLLENQGLVERLSTRHIIAVDLQENMIRQIYETICDIELRAISQVAGQEDVSEFIADVTNPGMNEFTIHQTIAHRCKNSYLQNLLANAGKSYIRFAIALQTQTRQQKRLIELKETLKKVGTSKAQADYAGELKLYFEGLSELVIEERRKNKDE